MKFKVIDGCPCPASIAPYVYIVLRDAGQRASSIYRGRDARAILHYHGKRTQAEIYDDPAYAGKANRPGQSQHELRSDGNANAGPVGRRLEEWEIGVDSGIDTSAAKRAINGAAERHGWATRHPYARGVEAHHWCFRRRPRAKGLRMRARVIRLRATLPSR